MPTEKNETKVDQPTDKKKLLYVTLVVPLIGATIALSFGDPACLQNIGQDETTTSTVTDTTEDQTTSTGTTSTAATSDVSSSTVSSTTTETDATTSL